jgi:hypothetical protein
MPVSPKKVKPPTIKSVEEFIDWRLKNNAYERFETTLWAGCDDISFLSEEDRQIIEQHYLKAGWKSAVVKRRSFVVGWGIVLGLN